MSGGLSVFFIGMDSTFCASSMYGGAFAIRKLKKECMAASRWFLVAGLQLCDSSSYCRIFSFSDFHAPCNTPEAGKRNHDRKAGCCVWFRAALGDVRTGIA